MERIILPGQKYRHFKNKLYQIICLQSTRRVGGTGDLSGSLWRFWNLCPS